VISFNPRARAGRDGASSNAVMLIGVSIHAPARGATRVCASAVMSTVVSIHAPARGATWDDLVGLLTVLVSIHAPARGATRSYENALTLIKFQSTRPRGARRPPPPS